MKSALSVSMHKAGSSIADLILTDFFSEKGYEIDRWAIKVMSSPLPEPEYFSQHADTAQPDGVYYGMARNPGTHVLPMLDNLRIILQMRDPRDCLTSAYFSFRQSHILPENEEKRATFEKYREWFNRMSVDKYVIEHAPDYRMRCERLQRLASEHPDCLVLTYEEMVENTPAWLARISDFIDQPLTDALVEKLGKKIDFRVAKENQAEHKRQVKPGDHRRKLEPATIEQINEILAPGLKTFGYAD